jgi:hypothetical protein
LAAVAVVLAGQGILAQEIGPPDAASKSVPEPPRTKRNAPYQLTRGVTGLPLERWCGQSVVKRLKNGVDCFEPCFENLAIGKRVF